MLDELTDIFAILDNVGYGDMPKLANEWRMHGCIRVGLNNSFVLINIHFKYFERALINLWISNIILDYFLNIQPFWIYIYKDIAITFKSTSVNNQRD
ncbi:unnamed protein product [Hermetia illucens]|uniref:Uncharacterized protein n=1 Tax=Hermetia illucens TaxID=343691 RepID=A0A7R8UN22_HERIL|nr:unnamed protein product [Hermetia illucens]